VDEEQVAVGSIECPLSMDELIAVEERFSLQYLLASEHHGADRYLELLEIVTQ
jgi:hypothetical protein